MSDHSASEPTLWIYYLGLVVTVTVWGLNFPIIKFALDTVHPVVVNAIRITISTFLLGAVYIYQQRQSPQDSLAVIRSHGWAIAGLGLLGHVLYQVAFIFGLDYTTSGNAALIMASSPFATGLAGYLLSTERLNKQAWAGLLVTVVGTGIVVLGGSQQVSLGATTLTGNLIMVGAALGWGAYTALSKPLLGPISPLGLTFLTMLAAPPLFWAMALPYLPATNWAAVDWKVWTALLYSGALSTGLAYVLWNRAVKFVGASHTAGFGNLVPIIALTSGALLLDEPVFPLQLLGGALIIGGLLVMNRSRHRL